MDRHTPRVALRPLTRRENVRQSAEDTELVDGDAPRVPSGRRPVRPLTLTVPPQTNDETRGLEGLPHDEVREIRETAPPFEVRPVDVGVVGAGVEAHPALGPGDIRGPRDGESRSAPPTSPLPPTGPTLCVVGGLLLLVVGAPHGVDTDVLRPVTPPDVPRDRVGLKVQKPLLRRPLGALHGPVEMPRETGAREEVRKIPVRDQPDHGQTGVPAAPGPLRDAPPQTRAHDSRPLSPVQNTRPEVVQGLQEIAVDAAVPAVGEVGKLPPDVAGENRAGRPAPVLAAVGHAAPRRRELLQTPVDVRPVVDGGRDGPLTRRPPRPCRPAVRPPT